MTGAPPGPHQVCEALSSHGYYGIEPQVVIGIADWIAQH
jgi:hypothetical protein